MRDNLDHEVGERRDFRLTQVKSKPLTHIAGFGYRALGRVGQALLALNRRYLINEKGTLIEAAEIPDAVDGLVDRTDTVWAALGKFRVCSRPRDLERARRRIANLGPGERLR
ncbi:hypothetical protein [Microvirga makkahensis]|uniref:Uncharacterized protein n=1 Tax=Microvirga makkahensis TaxID=1128670 RepID=A0A7X3MU98_9HYPH|nr:hypothetical protein [Microvirga makkahensis]MXQ13358.1 hypothetical protein [Microvirga makkahensis]